jgi:hypothetical protein
MYRRRQETGRDLFESSFTTFVRLLKKSRKVKEAWHRDWWFLVSKSSSITCTDGSGRTKSTSSGDMACFTLWIIHFLWSICLSKQNSSFYKQRLLLGRCLLRKYPLTKKELKEYLIVDTTTLNSVQYIRRWIIVKGNINNIHIHTHMNFNQRSSTEMTFLNPWEQRVKIPGLN